MLVFKSQCPDPAPDTLGVALFVKVENASLEHVQGKRQYRRAAMMLPALLGRRRKNAEFAVAVENPAVFYHAAFGEHHDLAPAQDFGGQECQQTRLVVGHGADAIHEF